MSALAISSTACPQRRAPCKLAHPPKAQNRAGRVAGTRAAQNCDGKDTRKWRASKEDRLSDKPYTPYPSCGPPVQAPSDALLKTFGVAAAVQMTLLPFAGSALAIPPIEAATRQAGDAQKKYLSDGAFDPLEREKRNTRNAESLVRRYDLVKSRFSTAGALANNTMGNQNIYKPLLPKRTTSGKSSKSTPDPVSFRPAASRPAPALHFSSLDQQSFGQPLQVTNVRSGGAGGASRDLESNYGGENSVGGPSEGSDPKKGGDLKDSANKFAGEFQGDKRSDDTAAFGSGTPNEGGVTNIREGGQKVPNFLGGKGVLRDDNISPEQAAQDNIATARAGKGSILDSAKKAFGVN